MKPQGTPWAKPCPYSNGVTGPSQELIEWKRKMEKKPSVQESIHPHLSKEERQEKGWIGNCFAVCEPVS